MAYIETLAPRGYDPHALFVYPYEEGIRNLRECPEQPALWERITHAAAGILLLIPLINTIVFLILRELTAVHVFNDDHHAVQVEEIPEVIQQLNESRNTAVQLWTQGDGEYLEIARIELKAVEQMNLVYTSEVAAHLRISEQRHPALIELDGQIRDAKYWRAYAKQAGLPSAGFTQVGGVHQYRGGNHLCGYYALFYMFQAVSGNNEFASRDALHPMLEKWTHMIAKKRGANWLSNHRNEQIPSALEVSVRGLGRDDIHHLIENDPDLACLLITDNCFVMEMDEWRAEEPWTQPLTPLGNRLHSRDFPLYFILKESNMHYYFVWAETPWEFKVVHSLGSSIHNSNYFSEDTFFDIVECLFTKVQ